MRNYLTDSEKDLIDNINLEGLTEPAISPLWYIIDHELCWYLTDGMAHFQLMSDSLKYLKSSKYMDDFLEKWGIKFSYKEFEGFDVLLGKVALNSECFIPMTKSYLQREEMSKLRRALFGRDYMNYIRTDKFIQYKDAVGLTDKVWSPFDFEDISIIKLGVNFGRTIIDRSSRLFLEKLKGVKVAGYELSLKEVCIKLSEHYRDIAGLEDFK